MPTRASASLLFAAVAIALTACPRSSSAPDAGDAPPFSAGNPSAKDACSGGCSANQRCNVQKRICEDACGGCDAGTCAKVSQGVYACQPTVTTCNGTVCQPGQVACINGACSCISSAHGSDDSCRPTGQWCHAGACSDPGPQEQCEPSGPSCPQGYVCDPVFGETQSVCVKDCAFDAKACDRGDLCNGGICLPQGLFGTSGECNQNPLAPDGGLEKAPDGGLASVTVQPGNTCLLKGDTFKVTDPPGAGNGNCTYALYKFWQDGLYPFPTCRPPGLATEGQVCKADVSVTTKATQCATGLHCALTGGGDQGVCLRACNANPARFGIVSQPACGTGESCVNLYRYWDPNDNAVLGVCMKDCNVFEPSSASCPSVGSIATSCVPASADGQLPISFDGRGLCLPRQQTISQVGQGCSGTDPFRGAACGSAQVCTPGREVGATPACTAVCDLACSGGADAGAAPVRCGSEANGVCPAGKSCQRVTATAGAFLGLCR